MNREMKNEDADGSKYSLYYPHGASGCSLTVAPQRGWEGDAGGTDRDRHTGGDQAAGGLYTGLRSSDFILPATNSKNWAFILHILCWGWQRKTPTFTRA